MPEFENTPQNPDFRPNQPTPPETPLERAVESAFQPEHSKSTDEFKELLERQESNLRQMEAMLYRFEEMSTSFRRDIQNAELVGNEIQRGSNRLQETEVELRSRIGRLQETAQEIDAKVRSLNNTIEELHGAARRVENASGGRHGY